MSVQLLLGLPDTLEMNQGGKEEYMPTDLLEQVTEHMKILGYKIESDGTEYLYASHPTKANAIFKGYQGAITFCGYIQSNKTARDDRLGYLEFLNSLNHGSTTTRFTAREDGRLIYEAVYSGPYEKSAFGVFLVLWALDTVEQFKSKLSTLSKYVE